MYGLQSCFSLFLFFLLVPIFVGVLAPKVDITGGPKHIVAARHALAARIAEWRTTNNPNGEPEEPEYTLKVRFVLLVC